MAKNSGVSWCTHSFNPWWGCEKISPGCKNCYAEAFSRRLGKDLWGADKPRQIASEATWSEPLKWDQEAGRAGRVDLVFCGSMMDFAEIHDDTHDARERLFSLIDDTPNLVWQLLTKRPENLGGMFPDEWYENPPGNAWLGVSAEDQKSLDSRAIRLLLPWNTLIPDFEVLFLSLEPILEYVSLKRDKWFDYLSGSYRMMGFKDSNEQIRKFDLVIVGAESGSFRRRYDTDWARAIRDECAKFGTAFYYKQGSAFKPGQDDLLDGRRHKEMPGGIMGSMSSLRLALLKNAARSAWADPDMIPPSPGSLMVGFWRGREDNPGGTYLLCRLVAGKEWHENNRHWPVHLSPPDAYFEVPEYE